MMLPDNAQQVYWWFFAVTAVTSGLWALYLHRAEIIISMPWNNGDDWTAHQMARHVAFASKWGASQSPETYSDAVSRVGYQICHKLANFNHSVATAVMSDKSGDDHVRTQIDAKEWARAKIAVNLLLEEIGDGGSFINIKDYYGIRFYSDVKFNSALIKYIWPTAKRWRENPNNILTLSIQAKKNSDSDLHQHQNDWWERNKGIFCGP